MAPETPQKPESGDMASDAAPAQNGTSNENSAAASSSSSTTTATVGDHLAQALRDLARGEQTANALEANLTNLHSKLDALLSELGVPALEDEEEASASPEHDGNHQSGGGAGTNGDKKKPVT